MLKLRITVFGGGSVGLAIAASCACAGLDVTLLTRGSSVGLLQSVGIAVTGVTGTHTVSPYKITVDDAERPNVTSLDCDILVVATKAYQVSGALIAIAAQAGPGAGPKSVLLL
jgi:2-dehydropantoate 2-reductase